MGNKVTFDYSKAANVVGAEEVAAMEKWWRQPKKCWYPEQDLETIFWGGLTFL